MMEGQARETKSIFGVVIMKDWMHNPENGQSCLAVSGPLELVRAKEDFGFQPKGNETNWGVRVGTDQKGVLILGCQIRSVYWGQALPAIGVAVWDIR